MPENYVALMYDFDKTLSPKDMQEYGFIPAIGFSEPLTFWQEVNTKMKTNQMDQILTYMKVMLDYANATNLPLTRELFSTLGTGVALFPGVQTWFQRINEAGRKRGLVIEHYIVSSGLKEIIQGTSIADEFKEIYACEYLYENKVATWPAQAVNYTTKTQYIFRINKGVMDVTENEQVNAYVPYNQRRIPFANMIYVGDGMTDIPCMRLVLEKGGSSIAIYNQASPKSLQDVRKLLKDQRVNYCAPADYREDSAMEALVELILDRIAARVQLQKFEEIQVQSR